MLLSERFSDALVYALQLHRGQQRKLSGAPYATHLLAVTALVLENGGSENEAIAALLHDAVEDQGGRPVLAEIERRFGREVAELVEGCTDAYEHPKPPWRQRKEAFLERFAGASHALQLIKAADQLDNARSLLSAFRRHGAETWTAFRGGREGTLWYYDEVLKRLPAAGLEPLTDEIRRVVAELHQAIAGK